MIIFNTLTLKKTFLVSDEKINFQKRFYPGPNTNPVGHIHKIINALEKKIPNSVLEINRLFLKAKPSILRYDPSKINNQLNHNYILKKFLPVYEKNGVLIPHVIETFPQKTIPGQFTLAENRLALFDTDSQFLLAHSYILTRYMLTMYGGVEIKDVNEILNRVKQLFTEDKFIEFYKYPFNSLQGNDSLFPLLQHWLSFDTYHLRFLTDVQQYPSNLKISQEMLSLIRNLELQVIFKTHKFKFDENKDEFRLLNTENSNDLALIKQHAKMIQIINKQVEPEMLAETLVGVNDRLTYSIETKITSFPELNLAMFNGFSSISPCYQGLLSANKVIGDLSVKATKHHNVFNPIIPKATEDLKALSKNLRHNKENFNENYQKWTQELYNTILKSGKLYVENTSYLPSIITPAFSLDENNYFHLLQKENPELLHNMIKDISKTIDLKKHFPSYQQMRSYNFYDNNLSFMLTLKKYNLLENYYAFRRLLLNIDIDV